LNSSSCQRMLHPYTVRSCQENRFSEVYLRILYPSLVLQKIKEKIVLTTHIKRESDRIVNTHLL